MRGVLPRVRSLVGLQGRKTTESDWKKKTSFAEVFPCWQITSFCLVLEINAEKAMAPESSTLAWKIP